MHTRACTHTHTHTHTLTRTHARTHTHTHRHTNTHTDNHTDTHTDTHTQTQTQTHTHTDTHTHTHTHLLATEPHACQPRRPGFLCNTLYKRGSARPAAPPQPKLPTHHRQHRTEGRPFSRSDETSPAAPGNNPAKRPRPCWTHAHDSAALSGQSASELLPAKRRPSNASEVLP